MTEPRASAPSFERTERVFAELLKALDSAEERDLPTTKAEWLTFIDIGISVMSIYATHANGYPKGGARVSTSYPQVLYTYAKIDPVRLWQTDESFRKPE